MRKSRPKLTVLSEVKLWAWPQLREKILTLLAEEPEFVGEHACFKWPNSPLKFISQYGLNEADMYETYDCLKYIDPNKQPIRAIQQILAYHPSWGEFLGGVIGAVGSWSKHDRDQVLPFLHTAVNKAMAEGVDH